MKYIGMYENQFSEYVELWENDGKIVDDENNEYKIIDSFPNAKANVIQKSVSF